MASMSNFRRIYGYYQHQRRIFTLISALEIEVQFPSHDWPAHKKRSGDLLINQVPKQPSAQIENLYQEQISTRNLESFLSFFFIKKHLSRHDLHPELPRCCVAFPPSEESLRRL